MKDLNVGVENVNPTPNLATLDDDVVGVAIDIVVRALAMVVPTTDIVQPMCFHTIEIDLGGFSTNLNYRLKHILI